MIGLLTKFFAPKATGPNPNKTERVEVLTAERTFEMKLFKDLFGGIRDVLSFFSTLPKRFRDGIRRELKPILSSVSPILVLVSLILLAITGSFMHNRILNNKVREPI